ncbi:MAG: mechanosensitive ion channel [Burkholderiaceae bacterium]|nr:mechanosensitive ion channel [Burkholderiaceae bacterium]
MPNTGFVEAMRSALGAQLPDIVVAVALLLLGWVAALVAAAAVRRVLSLAQLNRRIAPVLGHALDAETGTSRLAFWFVLAVALAASANVLDLQAMSEPFAEMIGVAVGYLPQLLAALVLALLGWLLALLVRNGLTKLLDRTTIDERLSAEAGMAPISDSIGNVGYWVVLLLFLPMILGALGLQGLLGPVRGLFDALLGFLPDLVHAAIVVVVGYYVAKIAKGIVVHLLAAVRLQAAARALGLGEAADLPALAGMVVFFSIFVPALISALDALQVESITGPARLLLSQFVSALPDLLAAVLIVGVTWYVARFVAGLVSSLLEGAGVDRLGERLGLGPVLGGLRLSRLIGRLLVFFAMLFALAQAANRLRIVQLSELVGSFIVFGADVLMGTTILLVGLWLANLLGSAVGRSEHRDAPWLGGLVRVLIIGLVLAMGLRSMGVAESIVNLAFGLTLGAVAIAVALSFGLGGREAAGKLMERWFSKLRRD